MASSRVVAIGFLIAALGFFGVSTLGRRPAFVALGVVFLTLGITQLARAKRAAGRPDA